MKDIDTVITDYQPTDRAIDVVRSVKIALLVGISGAGKDTIKQRLLATGKYHDIVSHTTRAPRFNHGKLETDGIEYHFVSVDQMAGMLDRHELIEANRYSNNIYATSVAEFERARDENHIAITDLDINGVEAYKAIAPQSVFPIFLLPPSYDIWVQRWRLRYGEDYKQHLDDFERRKRTAIDELQRVLEVPYFSFVINDDLGATTKQVDTIAQTGVQDEAVRIEGRKVAETLLVRMMKSSPAGPVVRSAPPDATRDTN